MWTVRSETLSSFAASALLVLFCKFAELELSQFLPTLIFANLAATMPRWAACGLDQTCQSGRKKGRPVKTGKLDNLTTWTQKKNLTVKPNRTTGQLGRKKKNRTSTSGWMRLAGGFRTSLGCSNQTGKPDLPDVCVAKKSGR